MQLEGSPAQIFVRVGCGGQGWEGAEGFAGFVCEVDAAKQLDAGQQADGRQADRTCTVTSPMNHGCSAAPIRSACASPSKP